MRIFVITSFINTTMEASYSPVQWVYREVIDEAIANHTKGKIVYFDQEAALDEEEGMIVNMEEVRGQGIFIHLDNGKRVRIDRIITLFGKPGAAYDEYNAYALSCMECMGGYEKEDLD